MLKPKKMFFSHAMAFALTAPFAGIVSADETRGLKSTGPIKPEFQDPRFVEPQRDPLTTERVLPAPPPKSNTLSNSASLVVTKLVIEGSTVLSPEELQTLTKAYEGRRVSIDELQALRQQLSLLYFQRGYVNSGVLIPEQKVSKGVVRFKVIEGELSKLNIEGNEGLVERYIRDRINKGVSTPLNVNNLQAALRELQQNRLIKKINAQLKPASALGKAELDVLVTEAKAKQLSLAVDNYRSPSVGAEEVTLAFADHNLLGRGDQFYVSGSISEGLTSADVSYRYPVTVEGLSVEVFYAYSDSEVVEEPFDRINIESESSNAGFNVEVPIYQQDNAQWRFNTGFKYKESSSFLLGEPFSFSAGAIAGESRTSVLDAGLSFVERSASQVYSASVSMRLGLDAFESNISDDDEVPDSEFIALLLQGQYALRIERLPGAQIIARSAAQISFDPLLSLEKFAVGGHSSVRGYRENQLVRDNGVTASLEFRFAPFADYVGRDPYNLQLVPFLDWGRAWDEDVPSQNDEKLSIYSAGLGLIWSPIVGLNTQVFWGEALEDDVKSDNGDDLQDDGLHFSLSYAYSF